MKVLMIEATGKYADFVVPELKQRGATVRALVRDKSKSGAARQRGRTRRRSGTSMTRTVCAPPPPAWTGSSTSTPPSHPMRRT